MHNEIDTLEFPSSVEMVTIIGTGLPTARGVYYTNCVERHALCVGKESETLHEWLYTLRGDGTVVTASAKGGVGVDESAFVSLSKVSKDENENYKHGTMLSSERVQEMVLQVLKGEGDEMESDGEGVSGKRVELRVYSPVDVHLYRGGKHTGVVEGGRENDFGREYEEEIPTSHYEEWGGVTYIGTELYGDEEVEVVFESTGVGEFTLVFSMYEGELLVGEYVFKDVPVGFESCGWIELGDDGEEPVLHYDGDGDGEEDLVLRPGEEVSSTLLKWVQNKFRVITKLLEQKGKGTATAVENQFAEIFRKLQKGK